MDFEIGQQVECIDGEFPSKDRYWVKSLPAAGGRYTIESMETGHRGLGLRLRELQNPQIPVRNKDGSIFQFVPTFLSTRFRPTTDIGSLRELLTRELVPS